MHPCAQGPKERWLLLQAWSRHHLLQVRLRYRTVLLYAIRPPQSNGEDHRRSNKARDDGWEFTAAGSSARGKVLSVLPDRVARGVPRDTFEPLSATPSDVCGHVGSFLARRQGY